MTRRRRLRLSDGIPLALALRIRRDAQRGLRTSVLCRTHHVTAAVVRWATTGMTRRAV